jgi:hypothetical protein
MTDDLKTRREQLIKRLTAAQNTRAFSHVDILTITGAMSDEQLEKYTCDKEREAACTTLLLRFVWHSSSSKGMARWRVGHSW